MVSEIMPNTSDAVPLIGNPPWAQYQAYRTFPQAYRTFPPRIHPVFSILKFLLYMKLVSSQEHKVKVLDFLVKFGMG
jgi:hypothetical protein